MSLPTRKPKDRHPYLQDPESRLCSLAIEPGDYAYVQDGDGAIWIVPNGPHQHPRVLGGARPAAAAGELTVDEKREIVEVNNLSGTFQIGPESLVGVVAALRSLGFQVPEEAIKRYPKSFF